MKIIGSIICGAALSLSLFVSASADEYVHGYTRSNGTVVQGYMRSSPDGNPYNNYSTKGNVNPYTGAPGTKNPYESGNASPAPYTNPYVSPYTTTP